MIDPERNQGQLEKELFDECTRVIFTYARDRERKNYKKKEDE